MTALTRGGRCLRPIGAALPAARAAAAGKLDLRRSRRAGAGCGVVILALGKHGARRAQLFERYRSHRSSSIPTRPVPGRARADRAFRAPDAALVTAPAGAHRATAMCCASICGCAPIPARPRSRSRLPAAFSYYETLWTELGARRPDQGAARSPAISRLGAAVSRRSHGLHLAQIFRLCGDRRHSRDEAANPCRARPCRSRRRRP